jgi:amino acid transporter
MMAFAGCATAATVSLAFGGYLQHFVKIPVGWVALGLLSLFTLVNILGVKESGWFNAVFTLVEIAGLTLFIAVGWHSPQFGDALATIPTWGTVSSAALLIFAYFGFENIVNLAEETVDAEKTVPRAILLSLFISTVLYIFVGLAAVALMPPEALAQTDAALTDAAKKTFPKIAGVLGGIALFSTANTALIALVATSRVLYGIASDNSLPRVFAYTQKTRHTPWVAAIAALVIACALLPLGKVEAVASVSAFATMVAFVSVNVALIVLRRKHPRQRRPFRVPLSIRTVPILPCIAIGMCLVFLLQFERVIYIIGFGAFVFAGCLYGLHRKLQG